MRWEIDVNQLELYFLPTSCAYQVNWLPDWTVPGFCQCSSAVEELMEGVQGCVHQ